MTSLTGNICLALAALIYLPLFMPLFHHKVPQSSDQGATGYVLLIALFLHFIFLGLMTCAYISINRQGGFNWLSNSATVRISFLAVGLLSCVIISVFSIMSRLTQGSSSAFLQSLMNIAPAVILVVLVGTGFILNNSGVRESIPTALYKGPLLLLNGVCLVGILGLVAGALFSSSPGVQGATRNYENNASIINNRLTEIESLDAKEDAVRLLEFTGGLYPTEVRQKAVAKFRTNPDWQQTLIDLLENDHALEAFSLLQSNEVADKNLFLKPVLNGVASVANWIRSNIQGTSPSGFYTDMFTDEVNRVLLTVDKFQGMGVDYLPSIREVRAALDEPTPGKKIKFDCVPVLDQWIARHAQ